tara:strand:- start:377 stop:1039 length:663 start_codon:yes stop_codon:yes gene_type:complete
MSVVAGFTVVLLEGIFAIYKKVHAINFGIYGVSKVGKTTLHHQIRTRGEVPNIKKRTVGLEKPTRKIVKIDGNVQTVRSSDVGGESIYWSLWLKDYKKRKPKYVIFMIDDRHLNNRASLEHQVAWKYLVDMIMSETWPNGKKKKHKDYPEAIGVWANKFDLWGKNYPLGEAIDKHPIFEPFKYGMQKLNGIGIPTFKYIVSAKSDPEMVYRGIMTMIKDY